MAPQVYIVGTVIKSRLYGIPCDCPLYMQVCIEDVSGSMTALTALHESHSVTSTGSGDMVWNHPLDYCITLKKADIAPRLCLRLLTSTKSIIASGSCSISMKPGMTEYVCALAKPDLNRLDQLKLFFLHEYSATGNPNMCIPCGTTKVELNVITRNLGKYNLQT